MLRLAMEDFKEKIAAAVEKGREAHTQEQKKDREFRDGWDQLRLKIRETFFQVKEVLKEEEGWRASVGIVNDNIALHVSPSTRKEFELRLARNEEKRHVDCTVSPDVLQEGKKSYELAALEDSELQHLVIRFIEGVAVWPLQKEGNPVSLTWGQKRRSCFT